MAERPSQEWKDGTLVRRGIQSFGPADAEEAEAVTGRPNDTPEDNSTFASRAKARTGGSKAVESAENKSVKKAARK